MAEVRPGFHGDYPGLARLHVLFQVLVVPIVPEDWLPSGPARTRNEILPSASELIVIDASTIPGISGSTILSPYAARPGAGCDAARGREATRDGDLEKP